ncbi:MAG TPA: peptide chain release factor N(5)-glutamine methyltransferase [Phnomibacter sp.]|nr:peptide chain release factor N(5)-glutamine methyltransferase [Phnomibacter sp.]
MNISRAEQQLAQQLSSLYDHAEAVAITNMVMQEISGQSKSSRRLNEQLELTDTQQQQLEKMTEQLLQHCPVQYVIGKSWFYDMELLVNESVLIPRPETEELVQWILDEEPGAVSILDIGTGSGCIPIALKKNLPESKLSALDISEAALAIAKKNATDQNTEVHFSQVNILDESAWPEQRFDIIVSNPPYIPVQELNALDKNVTDWEPHLALFVPNEDPLLFYAAIAHFAKTHLTEKGKLFFECHQQYVKQVLQLLQSLGFDAQQKADLFGNDRMVRAMLAN